MRILIAGAGVIGTVYGAHLGAAGHAVSVRGDRPAEKLSRGQPTERAPAGCPALFAVKLSRTDSW
jgi:hypothetical protein